MYVISLTAPPAAAAPGVTALDVTLGADTLVVGQAELEIRVDGGAPLTGARVEARLGRSCTRAEEDLSGELLLARSPGQITLLSLGSDGLRSRRSLPSESTNLAALPRWGLALLATPDRLLTLDPRRWDVVAEHLLPGVPWPQPDEGQVWVGGTGVAPTGPREIRAEVAGDHVAFSADSHWMFVAEGTRVARVDTWTGSVRRVETGAEVVALAWSPSRESLYVAHADGTLQAYDLEGESPRTTLRTAPGPAALAMAPDGRHLYVRAPASRSVAVIDTARDRLLREAHLWEAPEDLAFAAGFAWVHLAGDQLLRAPLDATPKAAPGERASFTAGWTLMPSPNPSGVGHLAPTANGVLVARGGEVCAVPDGGCVPLDARQVVPLGPAIREVAPGRYTVPVTLPTAGEYAVVVSLASPRLTRCLALTAVAPEPP